MKIFLISIVLLFFTKQATAEVVKIVAPEVFPFVYLEGDQVKGSLVDCLRSSKAHQFHIEIMPWARAIEEVKHGRRDALMPTLLTSKRQQFLTFPSQPLLSFKEDVIVSLSNKTKNKNKQVIVGKLRSASINESVLKKIPHDKIDTYNAINYQTLLKLLVNSRIDYAVGDYDIFFHTAKKLNISQLLEFHSPPEEHIFSYLAFSKKKYNFEKAEKIMKSIYCHDLLPKESDFIIKTES